MLSAMDEDGRIEEKEKECSPPYPFTSVPPFLV
jgi:hypothetical protein